jgi:hypothetical protein
MARRILRARPQSRDGTSAGCKAPDQELDDREDDHRGRDLDPALEVLGEAAVAPERGQAALHHLPRQHLEAAHRRRPLDDPRRRRCVAAAVAALAPR